MSFISLSLPGVISIFFEPKEPTLTQSPIIAELSREAIKAIIAENEVLVASCAKSREALASAYSDPVVTIPSGELPSMGFFLKRREVEAQSGTKLQKFFAE